jgi:hypothetical protein
MNITSVKAAKVDYILSQSLAGHSLRCADTDVEASLFIDNDRLALLTLAWFCRALFTISALAAITTATTISATVTTTVTTILSIAAATLTVSATTCTTASALAIVLTFSTT